MTVRIEPAGIARRYVLLNDVQVGNLVHTAVGWRFHWLGEQWMKLNFTTSGEVLEAVKEPLALLNITLRLKD
jgi:hypothetical protein